MTSPSPAERLLAAWRSVIPGTEDVPADELMDLDLLETGADSLSALTLVSRLTAEFGVDVDVSELLDAGTPRNVLTLLGAGG